ncbi:metabotropic glutamate receptor-like [Patiria miniata]|uniref:G-protein coupled receptors family 3 profile domain-containing protein n=1 Tax=Patiria miniata TaxID=46514 RepID=A0A913Z7G3_PATMI|nr:metabotropic glutamate receptor-like [Patiria miniata]
MEGALVIFALMLLGNFIGRSRGAVPSAVRVNFTRPGDFVLGGLFPLHRDITCRGGRSYHLLERVETMAFAVEEINGRDDLLGNVTLGFDIRETCYRDDPAMWAALSLLGGYSNKQGELKLSTGSEPPTGRLIGVVGTSRSSTSVVASKATNIYDVPMISGFATSDELSDKDHFPNFLRTSPPDKQQARAIIDVLLHFDWRYVGMIYSLDTYGIHGTQELLTLAEQQGICVAFSVSVRKAATVSEIKESVRKIEEFDKARVVVMFGGNGGYEGMYFILQEFYRANPGRNLVLIGSDSFENFEKYGLHEMSQGSLFFALNIFGIPGFEGYFHGLSSTNNSNPWYQEYLDAWMDETGCAGPQQCPIPVSNRSSSVYHAVYAFAFALDSMLQSRCDSDASAVCLTSEGFDRREFLAHLLNVTFRGVDGGRFHFDEKGDPDGTYTVSSFRGRSYYKVGQWDSRSLNGHLSIDVDDILWPDGMGKPPGSLCIEECKLGQIVVPLEKKCCWGCKECPINAVVDGSSCRPCDEEFWPNEDRSQCRMITPSKVDITDAAMVMVIILCVLGLGLSLLSLVGLLHYRNHPLIKATSRELSTLTLLGTLLAWMSVAVYLAQPMAASCAAGEAMISLCFTLTYGPTLLKVNRIFRIFQSSKKSTKRPALVRPKDQLILATVLIALQVVVVIVSISVSPSRPKYLIPRPPRDYIEVYCDFGSGFIASCVYNLLLILVCCYYAFKTRKVPSNYNESKFIAVSVYSTLVLCLAAVPVYTTAVAVLQKVATLCMALLLNAILTVVCVYLPKLYAVKFLKDVRVMDWSSSAGSTAESTTAAASSMSRPGPSVRHGGTTIKVGPAET